MPSNDRWILYSPVAEGALSAEVPAWLSDLSKSQERLGKESEFVHLSEVACGHWSCGLLEGYVSPSTVVGAFFSQEKGHVLVLLQRQSPECVPQPSLVQGACKGAYQIPLSKAPVNRSELAALFNAAYMHLLGLGHLQ
jgi:hypothetical protein